MDIPRKLAVIGLLFLLTLASGFWVGNGGRPFNLFLTTGHKFLALAWVLFTAVLVYRSAKPIEPRTALFAVIALLGVSILALFASCALLGLSKIGNTAWLVIHRIGSALAAIATVLLARLFLLNRL